MAKNSPGNRWCAMSKLFTILSFLIFVSFQLYLFSKCLNHLFPVTAAAMIASTLTVVIFIFISEIRSTTHGKIMMSYAISLFCLTFKNVIKIIFEPNYDMPLYFLKFNCFNWIHCWCFAMAFDICLSLCKFKQTAEPDQWFKFYLGFVVLFSLPIFTWSLRCWVKEEMSIVFEHFSIFQFYAIKLSSAIFLMITACKAFQVLRSVKKSENLQFKKEMARWDLGVTFLSREK